MTNKLPYLKSLLESSFQSIGWGVKKDTTTVSSVTVHKNFSTTLTEPTEYVINVNVVLYLKLIYNSLADIYTLHNTVHFLYWSDDQNKKSEVQISNSTLTLTGEALNSANYQVLDLAVDINTTIVDELPAVVKDFIHPEK